MVQMINPNQPLKTLQENTLYYTPEVHMGYTQGGAWLYSNGSLFYCPSNPIEKLDSFTGQPVLQAVRFEDEECQVYEFPLTNFNRLQQWLRDATHFQQWTNYPFTAWYPEDVRAWQTQSIFDWSLDEIMTLIQILDTIRYMDETELQTVIPPLLNYWSYDTFQTHFKGLPVLSKIQFS